MIVRVQVPPRVLFGTYVIARIAQLVEHDLAKVGVASSSLVSRSQKKHFMKMRCFFSFRLLCCVFEDHELLEDLVAFDYPEFILIVMLILRPNEPFLFIECKNQAFF